MTLSLRRRFALAYLALACLLPLAALLSLRSWQGPRRAQAAPALTRRAQAAHVAAVYFDALSVRDYRRACEQLSRGGDSVSQCAASYASMNLGVTEFEIVSVQVQPPDHALVFANVDGIRGYLVLVWRGDGYRIESLAAD